MFTSIVVALISRPPVTELCRSPRRLPSSANSRSRCSRSHCLGCRPSWTCLRRPASIRRLDDRSCVVLDDDAGPRASPSTWRRPEMLFEMERQPTGRWPAVCSECERERARPRREPLAGCRPADDGPPLGRADADRVSRRFDRVDAAAPPIASGGAPSARGAESSWPILVVPAQRTTADAAPTRHLDPAC